MNNRKNQLRLNHVRHAGVFASRRLCAFTLVEMVIVMAIVVVLMTLILPGARALWEDRKLSEAKGTLRGMLMSARARATQGSQLETGLFFFVNEQGTQQIVTIEQVPEQLGDIAWRNVFRITKERAYSLPAPIRVVPRYVVLDELPSSPDSIYRFSAFELANDNFETPPMGVDQGQLHRNFFTMVYDNSGQLLVRRDVLIQDPDEEQEKRPRGDVTELDVGYKPKPSPGEPTVLKYFHQDNSKGPIDPTTTSRPEKIPFLIVGRRDDTTALNFPSVDGLLIYDNDAFDGLGKAADPAIEQAKRDYILRTGRPLYVNRLTGAVIEGPTGESIIDDPST